MEIDGKVKKIYTYPLSFTLHIIGIILSIILDSELFELNKFPSFPGTEY